jgi:VWFA-related protein
LTTRLKTLAVLSGVLLTTVGFAQEAGPTGIAADGTPTFSTDVNEATFSVDVDVVNILATVRDRDGHIVKDLTKDDFILKEQNKQQEIKYFARQTNLPLTIGLLVDVSGSQINLIESERRASYQFLEQVLRPEQDLTFVIKFAGEVELLQDLTGSREDLQDALRRLGAPVSYQRPHFFSFQGWPGGTSQGGGLPGGSPGWPGGGGGGSSGSPYPTSRIPTVGIPNTAAGTSMYDAVFLAADEVLAPQEGRKAVILISDGIDTTSMMHQHDAVDAAQRSDVIVYSIHYYDSGGMGGCRRGPFGGRVSVGVGGRGGSSADGASTLNWMSARTGGRMFRATDERSLEQVFEQIEEELRNQYSIGYSPSLEAGKSFRKVKLATKNKKHKVQTREGYYPKS